MNSIKDFMPAHLKNLDEMANPWKNIVHQN